MGGRCQASDASLFPASLPDERRRFMHITPRSIAPIIFATASVAACASFTEDFESGSNTGNWIMSVNNLPSSVSSGGNPGQYLQTASLSSSIPTWQTADTNYDPGNNDGLKQNSAFTGNWLDAGVTGFSADMNLFHIGSWTGDRTVSLELTQWTTAGIGDTAFFSMADMPNPPTGWNNFSFDIGAASGHVPTGWVFTHNDGTAGTDAEWGDFMKQVDSVAITWSKPGFFYPSFGSWTVGIDNIHIETAPVPEPSTWAAMGFGLLVLIRRRKA
jgi:hypothetical protein